jgi:hypothetical protein
MVINFRVVWSRVEIFYQLVREKRKIYLTLRKFKIRRLAKIILSQAMRCFKYSTKNSKTQYSAHLFRQNTDKINLQPIIHKSFTDVQNLKTKNSFVHMFLRLDVQKKKNTNQ